MNIWEKFSNFPLPAIATTIKIRNFKGNKFRRELSQLFVRCQLQKLLFYLLIRPEQRTPRALPGRSINPRTNSGYYLLRAFTLKSRILSSMQIFMELLINIWRFYLNFNGRFRATSKRISRSFGSNANGSFVSKWNLVSAFILQINRNHCYAARGREAGEIATFLSVDASFSLTSTSWIIILTSSKIGSDIYFNGWFSSF